MVTKKRRRWTVIPIGTAILGMGVYFGPISLEDTPPVLEITGVNPGKPIKGASRWKCLYMIGGQDCHRSRCKMTIIRSNRLRWLKGGEKSCILGAGQTVTR